MKRFASIPSLACALAGTLALGACSDDATAPLSPAAHAPSLSADAAAPGGTLVLFRGSGIPAGFEEQVAALGGSVTYAHAGVGFALVNGLGSDSAAKLAGISGVSDVQPDATFALNLPQSASSDLDAGLAEVVQSQGNPTTAVQYTYQWNMRAINAQKAWAAGKLGSSNVTVAILDTGIDYDNPDLNGLVDLKRSTSFVPGDDRITSTYFPTRNPISDYNGHGTNVATQVSSKAVAFAGVTSKTTLIGVKVLGANGNGSLGGILSGILWAADHGANVANMSLGGGFSKSGNGSYVSLIQRTMNYAKQQGMLVVVAAGNDSADMDHDGNLFVTYCGTAHVICVAATGPSTPAASVDESSVFTNFGRSAVSVAAPGGNYKEVNGAIQTSPWPWGNDVASWVFSYCSKTRLVLSTTGSVVGYAGCQAGNRRTGNVGTSQATPHVAGLAALLMAENGTGNPMQIKQAIVKSAIDLGQRGTDPYYGSGRIDVARALGL